MTPKGDKPMKKYLSLILSAIMVLSLFAAIAMAAVNVEICPQCDQGEIRYWVTTFEITSYDPCIHGMGGDDIIGEHYITEHTKCNYCGNGTDETSLHYTERSCLYGGSRYDK